MSENINYRNNNDSDFLIPRKRVFLDIDGTIARFHDNILDTEGHVQIELMYEPNFFRTLEPFQNLIDGVKLFMKKHPYVDVYTLSAAQHGDPPGFISQKDAWLDLFLPEIDKNHRIYPECGVRKSTCIENGLSGHDFLIDDYNKNLNEWIQDGGAAVKCKNNINHRGTGKFGGDIGNLWTGNMIYNLDSPEMILKNLESFILEPPVLKKENVRESSITKEDFDDSFFKTLFIKNTKNLPDFVIGTFEEEKEKFLDWISEGVNGPFELDSEKTSVLCERIEELVWTYGYEMKEYIAKYNAAPFGLENELDVCEKAISTTYQSFLNDVEFIKDQIHVQTDLGYYSLIQEAYLNEHIPEIANLFGYMCHREGLESLSLEKELNFADKAIKEIADKEMLMITANPIKENYPPVEIDISRRDLEFLFSMERNKNEEMWPKDVNEFLDTYTWDNGDWVKDMMDKYISELKDFAEIHDFSEAKYFVTITDDYSNEAVFYPEKIDKAFVRELIDKGYEGYRILISDIQDMKPGTLLGAALDPSIIKLFKASSTQKENLDIMIKNAENKISSEKNKNAIKRDFLSK